MFGTFPYEPEPDGAVFGPHHFYLGVLLILLVCWLYVDPESESRPWVVTGATLLSVFAFSLTWPYYPAVGAFGVLVLLGIATVIAVVRPFWWRSGLLAQSMLLVGLYAAWDDALSHALGWQTPLDRVWAEYLYPYASDPYGSAPPRIPTLPEEFSDVRVPTEVRLPTDVRLPTGVELLADGEALLAEYISDALAVVAL